MSSPPAPDAPPSPAALAARTSALWRRAAYIYGCYKARQAQSAVLRLAGGWSDERLEQEVWGPHHTWVGRELHDLAVSTRGFYLKVRVLSGIIAGSGNGGCGATL